MPGRRRVFSHVRDTMLELLFPVQCIGCGAEETWICERCQRSIPVALFSQCVFCNRASAYGKTCTACARTRALDGVISDVPYRQPLMREMIHAYKYNNAVALSFVLAHRMHNTIQKLREIQRHALATHLKRHTEHRYIASDFPPISDPLIDCIPVPLHAKKQKQRGYNQAFLLARTLKEISQYARSWNVRDVIRRTKATIPQAQLSTVDRVHNVHKAFRYIENTAPHAARIALIIDDVITSGSSCDEIASILKQNGYISVWGFAPAYGHHNA